MTKMLALEIELDGEGRQALDTCQRKVVLAWGVEAVSAGEAIAMALKAMAAEATLADVLPPQQVN